jgi:hypothetical protein
MHLLWPQCVDCFSHTFGRIALNASGRAALLFILIGFTLLVRLALLMVPESEEHSNEIEQQEHMEWMPFAWKRLFFPVVALGVSALLVFLLELSYTPTFQSNMYMFAVILSVGRLALRGVLSYVLKENLLAVPMLAAYLAVALLTCLGTGTLSPVPRCR